VYVSVSPFNICVFYAVRDVTKERMRFVLPRICFSHCGQINHWRTLGPNMGAYTGLGVVLSGRIWKQTYRRQSERRSDVAVSKSAYLGALLVSVLSANVITLIQITDTTCSTHEKDGKWDRRIKPQYTNTNDVSDTREVTVTRTLTRTIQLSLLWNEVCNTFINPSKPKVHLNNIQKFNSCLVIRVSSVSVGWTISEQNVHCATASRHALGFNPASYPVGSGVSFWGGKASRASSWPHPYSIVSHYGVVLN
jgi:hypothetical protein